MRNALETLTYWVKDLWKVALLVVGLAGLFVAFAFWKQRNYDMPAIEEYGEVVRFGAYGGETGPRPVVLVRLQNGSVVQLAVRRGATHHCRVGSRIRLIRRGEILTVPRVGCPPPTP